MAERENDAVNHPTHYTQGGIECIDAMQSAFGKDELAAYCKIAAFKYLWREESKGGTEDIKKAIWYLNKLIELRTEENPCLTCHEGWMQAKDREITGCADACKAYGEWIKDN